MQCARFRDMICMFHELEFGSFLVAAQPLCGDVPTIEINAFVS